MSIAFSRRRSVETGELDVREEATDDRHMTQTNYQTSQMPQPSYRFRILIFLLGVIMTWWCSTLLLSESFFNIRASSQKQNILGFSGDHAKFNITATAAIKNNTIDERIISKEEEKAIAVKIVEEQIQTMRSWSSSSSSSSITMKNNCQGKGIFVYDLPKKFNYDLVRNCNERVPWLCKYLKNEGKGEPILKLGQGWYGTHQYSLEPIFHHRILRHPCRVFNIEQAKVFFVPFYGGLEILRWNMYNVSNSVRDSIGSELDKWLQQQKPWMQSKGKDHVFVLGSISWNFRRIHNNSWGNNFLQLDNMLNSYKLLIERQPWEINEIGIPYPTYFHPRSDEDIIRWQSKVISSRRTTLASFAGADRADTTENIRSVLMQQCKSQKNNCTLFDCSLDACLNHTMVIGMFMDSEFCLQPPGDSPTRKSVFDSLIIGCIPVLFDPFTVYYQYPWYFPEEYQKYSVFIDKDEFKENKINIIDVLKKVPVEKRQEMRKYIIYNIMPGLVYGDSMAKFYRFSDAFDIVINNLIGAVTQSEM